MTKNKYIKPWCNNIKRNMNNYVFNNYIFANIKLPLQIKPDGTIETLHDYVNIHFEKCDQLPEKQNSRVNYDFLMNNLMELMKHKSTNASYISDDASQTNDALPTKTASQTIDHTTDGELHPHISVDEPIDLDANTRDKNAVIPNCEETNGPSFTHDIDPETQNKLVLFINQEELKNKKIKERNNITFKNKRYNTNMEGANRFTAKRR